MSYFPSALGLDGPPFSYTGDWLLDSSSTSTVKKYVLSSSYGVEFHDVNNTTRFKVNQTFGSGSTTPPTVFYITRGGTQTGPFTDEVVQDLDVIDIYDGSSWMAKFTIDMNGTSWTDPNTGTTVGPNKLVFQSGGSSGSGSGSGSGPSQSSKPRRRPRHNFW